jgi:hypothetical protein
VAGHKSIYRKNKVQKQSKTCCKYATKSIKEALDRGDMIKEEN